MTHPTGRTADHPIDPVFLDRWSPRAFTGEAMSHETLLSLLEAARWAPSAANGQPWRMVASTQPASMAWSWRWMR